MSLPSSGLAWVCESIYQSEKNKKKKVPHMQVSDQYLCHHLYLERVLMLLFSSTHCGHLLVKHVLGEIA